MTQSYRYSIIPILLVSMIACKNTEYGIQVQGVTDCSFGDNFSSETPLDLDKNRTLYLPLRLNNTLSPIAEQSIERPETNFIQVHEAEVRYECDMPTDQQLNLNVSLIGPDGKPLCFTFLNPGEDSYRDTWPVTSSLLDPADEGGGNLVNVLALPQAIALGISDVLPVSAPDNPNVGDLIYTLTVHLKLKGKTLSGTEVTSNNFTHRILLCRSCGFQSTSCPFGATTDEASTPEPTPTPTPEENQNEPPPQDVQ